VTALFNDLHDIAQVLAEHIREEVGIDDVQAGQPRDVGATAAAAARLTFWYATPQPGHRSDPVETQPDGARRFPPLSLSCFYVVTTSGSDNEDPIAAHHALGRIMTLFHDRPSLQLPLSDNPGAPAGVFSALGEGTLNVLQVPIAADQVDKIWTAFDLPVQPWALFEVTPVQLMSQRDDLGPAPLVLPGGIDLEIRAGTRPLIVRIVPEVVRPEGRVRIDALIPGELEAVVVDGIAVPTGSPSLTAADGGSPLLLNLDAGGLEDLGPGSHRLTVRTSGLVSRSTVLRIAEETVPVLDAPPALRHDPTTPLVLTGANLAAAEDCVVWPDDGVASPTDVRTLELIDLDAESVTVAADELDTLPHRPRPWRLAVRLGERLYTPYVLVELTA